MSWAELDDSSVPVLFEDFNETDLVQGVAVGSSGEFEVGRLTLPEQGTCVTVSLPEPATRILACYRLESETGRIGISTEIREGRTEVSNDIVGDWAHSLDRITPYRRGEVNHGSFFRNGSRFGRIRLRGTTGFDSFCIKAETGARGASTGYWQSDRVIGLLICVSEGNCISCS